MFVKRKKNRSGTTSIVVAEKTKGIYKELITIGVAKDSNEIDSLVNAGHEWISKEESRRHPQLDLYGEDREACDREREEVRRVLSNVSNILLNGCDLILDRTFDRIGFNRIDDDVFRKLVKARLAYPTIQMTVQRKMPITGRREYAGWKRLTSMVRSRKVTSTKEVTISFYPWMVK